MTLQKENNSATLERLIRTGHPCIVVSTLEEDHVLSLVRDAATKTPHMLNLWSINGGIRDGFIVDHPPFPDTEHPAAALFHLLKLPTLGISVFLDLAPHLRDERTLRLLRDLIDHARRTASHIVLVDHQEGLPDIIESLSARFDVALPDEAEVERLIRTTLKALNEKNRIQVDINRRAFNTILRNLRGLTRRQIERIIIETAAEDRRFDADDLHTILARKRQLIQGQGLLEFIETPETLDEVGGLRRLKQWLSNRAEIDSPEAATFGLESSRGLLMLGVQGAGKSYCAKAIAAAWKRPLLRMDVGSMYDRFVGESERNLRDAFRQAERMAPIILWIDEIEKAFASAASRSVDGGLSQRMFGALLTWMQERAAPVFLVATANDIEALPPELLRKGRFDEIFFVDLPTPETRVEIFRIHLRKRKRNPENFDLDQLAAASEGFTGAEIEQAIISALHESFAIRTELDTARIIGTLAESPPLSVVQAERVNSLRRWAARRFVPAD